MAVGEFSNRVTDNSLLFPVVRPLSVAELKDGIKERLAQPPPIVVAAVPGSIVIQSSCKRIQELAERKCDVFIKYSMLSEHSMVESEDEEYEDKEEGEECTSDPPVGDILYSEVNDPLPLVLEESMEMTVDALVQLHREDVVAVPNIDAEACDRSACSSDFDPELIPGAAEAAIQAERVRTMAVAHMKDAWANLRQEFEVQVLIWSQMMSMKAAGYSITENVKIIKVLRKLIESAMDMVEPEIGKGTCENSRKVLEQVLTKDANDGGLLNHSTRTMISAVLTAQELMMNRLELASSLDIATSGEADDATQLHLGILIEACDLRDIGLVYRIRRVLGLSMGSLIHGGLEEEQENDDPTTTPPNEDEVQPWAVGGTLDMMWGSGNARRNWRHKVDKKHSRSSRSSKSSSSKSARSAGSHGSRSSRRSSRSSRSSSSLNETVPERCVLDSEVPATVHTRILKERHYRQAGNNSHKGTPAQGMETGVLGMPGPPDVAPWITEVATPRSVLASAAAESVRLLALEGLEGHWDEVRDQFQVQLLVWGSLALIHGSSGPRAAERRSLQKALDSQDIVALECFLQKESEHLSNSTSSAMKQVLEAERLAKLRRELAKSLEAAGRAGDAWEPGLELYSRIDACQLEDLKLEHNVRRVLGLSMGDLKDRWKNYRHYRKGTLPKDFAGSSTTTKLTVAHKHSYR